jgi:hypothetical protein
MRLSISKSKNSESLFVIKTIRVNGKNTSKTVEKLGTTVDLMKKLNMDRDQVISWAKQYVSDLTKKEKDLSSDLILNLSQSKLLLKNNGTFFNGGYLFLKKIFYDLKLDKITKDISSKYKIEYDLCDILEKLIYARILNPTSKLSTYEYSKKCLEQPKFELNHLYRSLDILFKEKDYIEATVYDNSLKVVDRDTSVLYYDCTNYFFEINEASGNKQYGACKQHRPLPITQMGLFMDANGYPLAFCINPGNTNEQTTLKPLEERIIKDFSLSKFIVCTDAGLGSTANRKFNNVKNRSFIVTQSVKVLKTHLKEWYLEDTGWKLKIKNDDGSYQIKEYDISKLDESIYYNNVFYKERWINENGLEQRLIVTFSFKYQKYLQNIRETQINRAEKLSKNKSSMNHKRQNDPKRFIKANHYTEDGEIANGVELSIDN